MLNKLEQIRKSRKSDQSGFTIIEVMIVLAIAGLILLIVLLAIPALQRNSRNTQIKNDAANVVGAVSTYATDNDGRVPKKITVNNGTVQLFADAGDTNPDATAPIQKGTTFVTGLTTIPADLAAATAAGLDPGELAPILGRSCNGTSTTRSVAVVYLVETSNTALVKCVNS